LSLLQHPPRLLAYAYARGLAAYIDISVNVEVRVMTCTLKLVILCASQYAGTSAGADNVEGPA